MGILKLAIAALGIFGIATMFGIEGLYLGYGIAAKEDEKLNWASFDDPERKQILAKRISAAKHLDEVQDMPFVSSKTEETIRDVINFRTEIQES